MTQVFFSYTRRDPEFEQAIDDIFAGLEAEGLDVFRDKVSIMPGDLWQHRIGRALTECICGVAIWTPSAEVSKIMMAETDYLLAENKLIPVALDLDSVPHVYRGVQYQDLRGFGGDRGDLRWGRLMKVIRERISGANKPYDPLAEARMQKAAGYTSEQIEVVDPKERPQPTSSTFQDRVGFPIMRRVTKGAFTMGRGDAPLSSNERPEVSIVIERDFAVSVSPITEYQWNLAVQSGARGIASVDGAGTSAKPAVGMSWKEAQRYVAWLNTRLGTSEYRLPTEAEWEFWARQAAATSSAAGEQEHNLWTLREGAGCVWEWVEDAYSPSHSGADAQGGARSVADSPYRAARGGSYRSKSVSPYMRTGFDASFARDDIGFRVVRDLGGGAR